MDIYIYIYGNVWKCHPFHAKEFTSGYWHIGGKNKYKMYTSAFLIFVLLQKKDVRMLRFIQEVNTTTRSCALWDLDEDTEYIVHVQSISMGGSSPPSQPVLFRTPKESEKMASKSPGERESNTFLNISESRYFKV